jgi:hypothetical protein
MQIICEKQGRTQEAERFAVLSQRLWSRADAKDFIRLRQNLAAKAAKSSSSVASAGGE